MYLEIEMDLESANLVLVPLRTRIMEIRKMESEHGRQSSRRTHDIYVRGHNQIVRGMRRAGNEDFGMLLNFSGDCEEFLTEREPAI